MIYTERPLETAIEDIKSREKGKGVRLVTKVQTEQLFGKVEDECVVFEDKPELLADCHQKLEQHKQEVVQLEQKITEHKQIEQDLRQSAAELTKVNQELEHLVLVDALTQIGNRRCFDESLHREWHRSLREQQPISLIILDIDCFKGYNDLYGHPAGDLCLTTLAQTVKQALQRSTDLIARYGGEEFAVILPNTTTQGAIIVTELIQQAILDLSTAHENSYVSDVVTTSLGIATLVPTETQQPSILLEQTDRALYKAKQKGRNCYFVYV
ncbi:GGDEF domain-containing protein [Tumidithrix helvetica PCC 7403]|uniref:diguanylate cyclase n=1 Tax=Tumidithrix helvetica TaxID=3457545 RepID=UPI003CA096ED